MIARAPMSPWRWSREAIAGPMYSRLPSLMTTRAVVTAVPFQAHGNLQGPNPQTRVTSPERGIAAYCLSFLWGSVYILPALSARVVLVTFPSPSHLGKVGEHSSGLEH